MSRSIDEARAALRARQGSGARYDAPGAPARELDWARRGTAYFARILNGLSDAELDAPSALPGLSRRHVIAHVGYHARMLSELVAWVRTGQAGPVPREARVSPEDVAGGATLPAHALRYFFQHSAVHLDVEWRDLGDVGWLAEARDTTGHLIEIAKTPELRACTLWQHAIDLRAGGRLSDMPADFREVLARNLALPASLRCSFLLVAPDT